MWVEPSRRGRRLRLLMLIGLVVNMSLVATCGVLWRIHALGEERRRLTRVTLEAIDFHYCRSITVGTGKRFQGHIEVRIPESEKGRSLLSVLADGCCEIRTQPLEYKST